MDARSLSAVLDQTALDALLHEPWTMEEIRRATFMAAVREGGTLKAAAERLAISYKGAYNLLHRFTGLPTVDLRYLKRSQAMNSFMFGRKDK